MFVTENVPALFKKGTLKLQETDDGYRRVAEATLMIEPFPHQLAHEMGEDIAVHLFDENNQIRPELESIALNVRAGLQRATVRHHEELEPIAIIDTASIKDVKATVIEDKKTNRCWMSFSFVLVFSLESKEARNFVLDEFGKTLIWTFEGLQRDLLNQANLHDSIARMVPKGATMSVGVSGGEMTEVDPGAHRQRAKELRDKAKVN